jgi:uncharacterized protein YjbJ (UPF0337 family)
MSFDDLKGRVKQAAGRLAGNKRLERQGRADRLSSKVKETVGRVRGRLTSKDHR